MDNTWEMGRLCKEAAKEYLARGWNALAVCPPDHVGVGREHLSSCDSPGKVPCVGGGWKVYQTHKVKPNYLEEWWGRQPNANVGIVMGAVSGVIGVDVDEPTALKKLEQSGEGFHMPATSTFRTGRGLRYLYSLPPGEVFRTVHLDGVSLLGEGVPTVMPPSRHASGALYEWLDKGVLVPLAEAPECLLRLPGKTCPAPPFQPDEPITHHRDVTLFRMACAVRRHGASATEILALLVKVNTRCVPPLGEAQLVKISQNAARYTTG